MAILEVEHIQKSFDRTEVLKDISFSLEKGQVVSIIGSSGSGKTTLLRCLNFLERPDGGVIRVGGETLFDAEDPTTLQESQIRRKRLHFGLVFQSFNLFPQYTAKENVMLAKRLLAKEQPDFKAKKKGNLRGDRKAGGGTAETDGTFGSDEQLSPSALRRTVPACGYRPGPGAAAGYPLLR